MDTGIYYDGSLLKSKNALFKMCVGARGIGKTYYFKTDCVKKAIESKGKSTFIYLRRFKSEVNKRDMEKFLPQIADNFPDHDLRYSGGKFYCDKYVIGEPIALSVALTKKSVDFSTVKWIIFDEFLLDKGAYHYLQDEVTLFLDFYETVSRTRDVVCYMLSNAITASNPYFLFFGVKIVPGKRFLKTNTKECVVELPEANDFKDYKLQTRFGKMISNTEYGAYAIDNNFRLDDDTFIEPRAPTSKYYFTMKCYGRVYGVWIGWEEGLYYVSKTYDPNYGVIYSFTLDDMTPNTVLINAVKKSTYVRNFKFGFQSGNVRFDNAQIKKDCFDILKFL